MKTFGTGALSLALAFAVGAFGVHALRSRLDPAMLAVFQTGQQYQVYASLALMLVGLALKGGPGKWAGWLIGSGMFVFSASLYALALSGVRLFGAITPIGGVLMTAGLAVAAVCTLKKGSGPATLSE